MAYTIGNIKEVIEYHKKYPRRGPVRIGIDTGVYRDLNRAAIQRILDILKANKGISVEEVFNKLMFKELDEIANEPDKDDTFAAWKPSSASFDLDESGDVVEEPLDKIRGFMHQTLEMQKKLNEEEDSFLNVHGLRGKSINIQIRRYLFYILQELKEMRKELTNGKSTCN